MYYSFPSRHYNGYNIELNHFLDIVQGVAKSSVSGRMTKAISKIATACEDSATSGKPITLEWAEDEIPEDYVQ